MVKIRKAKPVDEASIVVEGDPAGGMVDPAQACIAEITAPVEVLEEPPGEECRCPRCRSAKAIVETSRPWDAGLKVRYMRCRACRMLFKDVLERTGAP